MPQTGCLALEARAEVEARQLGADIGAQRLLLWRLELGVFSRSFADVGQEAGPGKAMRPRQFSAHFDDARLSPGKKGSASALSEYRRYQALR